MASVESWSAEWVGLLNLAGLALESADELAVGRQDLAADTYRRRRDAVKAHAEGILGKVDGRVLDG